MFKVVGDGKSRGRNWCGSGSHAGCIQIPQAVWGRSGAAKNDFFVERNGDRTRGKGGGAAMIT
jgi:hypothetical protein